MESERPPSRKYDFDWSRVDPEIARLILRQGELRLEAQFKAAIAADQRAMVSAGICAAFAAALTTAMIANYSQYHAADVAWAGGTLAAALLCASASFLRCAKPTKFETAGNEPKEWFSIRNYKSLSVAIGGECENYQEWIDENEKKLSMNARHYWRAVTIAMLAPIVGAATFLSFHLPTIPLRLW